MPHYWLSFADQDRPAGSQFLGVVIVEAKHPGNAVPAARAKGCCPDGDGEALIGVLPPLSDMEPSLREKISANMFRIMDRAALVEAGLLLFPNLWCDHITPSPLGKGPWEAKHRIIEVF